MRRCQCTLTPCRTRVQAPDQLCRFCNTWCLRELQRRRTRRRRLFACFVAIVALSIGLTFRLLLLKG